MLRIYLEKIHTCTCCGQTGLVGARVPYCKVGHKFFEATAEFGVSNKNRVYAQRKLAHSRGGRLQLVAKRNSNRR